ncbi:MAG: hypothetical protein KGL39_15865 [Patescibacteria group bacterium]|nr:hypothetical protein [Patescibacteria group bacterium]
MAADYPRIPLPFVSSGMNLRAPLDRLPQGKWGALQNVRSTILGTLSARYGMTSAWTAIAGAPTLHSILRLNDPTSSPSPSWTRIVGAGTSLYYGTSFPTLADSGYSGNPLAFAIYRPSSSPRSWAYIGDSTRMRKIRDDGTNFAVGIAPPNVPASAALLAPNNLLIDDFETVGTWASGGVAEPLLATTPRLANAAITTILFDSGSSGWAQIAAASATVGVLGPGARTKLGPAAGGGSTEFITIQEVHPAITSTTVQAIAYDSGTSGPCVIQLSVDSPNLQPNSTLQLNSSEYVRVLSVTAGPTGIQSFRCSTVGTISAGNTVSGVTSFRAYLANSGHVSSDVLNDTAMGFQTSGAGIGYMSKTASFDLTNVGGRPLSPSDIIHISLNISDMTQWSQGAIMFDVDSSTNNFTQNYFYATFTPSQLVAAATQSQTAISASTTALQQQYTAQLASLQAELATVNSLLASDPGSSLLHAAAASLVNQIAKIQNAAQLSPGSNQWQEFFCTINDLIRVGTSPAQTLANVAAIRISFIATGSFICYADAWWVGGTYGPDSGAGAFGLSSASGVGISASGGAGGTGAPSTSSLPGSPPDSSTRTSPTF